MRGRAGGWTLIHPLTGNRELLARVLTVGSTRKVGLCVFSEAVFNVSGQMLIDTGDLRSFGRAMAKVIEMAKRADDAGAKAGN